MTREERRTSAQRDPLNHSYDLQAAPVVQVAPEEDVVQAQRGCSEGGWKATVPGRELLPLGSSAAGSGTVFSARVLHSSQEKKALADHQIQNPALEIRGCE
ncbi:hypothetical protein AGOR_G00222050 [Albula goreensis]|uniref:Uncharacterized protein n=1 Tax=Albula goreensis TaxID=1534307 RepID=A0A8T3CJ82_9TELE|nr:hypothetical protein AGOR_G00222050 [Albula goreensis]